MDEHAPIPETMVLLTSPWDECGIYFDKQSGEVMIRLRSNAVGRYVPGPDDPLYQERPWFMTALSTEAARQLAEAIRQAADIADGRIPDPISYYPSEHEPQPKR